VSMDAATAHRCCHEGGINLNPTQGQWCVLLAGNNGTCSLQQVNLTHARGARVAVSVDQWLFMGLSISVP
jgi:hypothetical protein